MVHAPEHARAEADKVELLDRCVRLQHCKHNPVRPLPAKPHRRVLVRDDRAQHRERCAEHLDAAQVGKDSGEHGRHAALAHQRRDVRRVPRNRHEHVECRQHHLIVLEVRQDGRQDHGGPILFDNHLHIGRVVRHVSQDGEQRLQQLCVHAVDALPQVLEDSADAVLEPHDDRRELGVKLVQMAEREDGSLEQRLVAGGRLECVEHCVDATRRAEHRQHCIGLGDREDGLDRLDVDRRAQ